MALRLPKVTLETEIRESRIQAWGRKENMAEEQRGAGRGTGGSRKRTEEWPGGFLHVVLPAAGFGRCPYIPVRNLPLRGFLFLPAKYSL